MTETMLYEPHSLLLGRGVSLFRAGPRGTGNLGRAERLCRGALSIAQRFAVRRVARNAAELALSSTQRAKLQLIWWF